MEYVQTDLSTVTLDQVARLHCECLPFGFISSLGKPFICAMYRAIGHAPGSCVIVCRGPTGSVDGFISGTISTQAMFAWILPRYGVWFLWHLTLRLWSLSLLRKIAETALYMIRRPKEVNCDQTGHAGDSVAELLSIAVWPDCRKKGVGRGLVANFEAFLRGQSCNRYKVVTHGQDVVSNGFYCASGFTLSRTFVHHGREMNEYVKPIGL